MNQYYSIQGGRRLEGTVTISGAKNAAVAIIPASILAGECCILENLPAIQDVQTLKHILSRMGAQVDFTRGDCMRRKAGYKCAVIYGGSKIDKTEVLRSFQYDDTIQVLLSSEVGSEGLDMQFCNTLVNYDLPWNPMVVEQRIGRIDRFGQESPKVNINTIVVSESILEDIYERLLARIGIFRESIGDLEAILDSVMETEDGKKITIQDALKYMERDFYADKLKPKEVEKKRLEIERAIENEKLNLKKIEEGLTNALTNDSYFRDEINKIVNNNAYVTSHELYQFVLQIIKEHLTTCELKQSSDPEVYILSIPKSDPKVVKRFLEQYQPADLDSKKLFRRYLTEIEDKLELRMTFDQERAFKEKKLAFINIYHPIIRAGVKMFEANQIGRAHV